MERAAGVRRRGARVPWIVFGVALVVGWSAAWLAGPWFRHSVGRGLGDEYDEIALNVLRHGAYSADPAHPERSTVTRGPVYPLYLAGLYRVFGEGQVEIVQRADLAVHAATAGLVAAILLPVGGPLAALAGGLAYALWPTTLYYAGRGGSETLLLLWLALSVVALLRWRTSAAARWALVAGAGLGLACLTRGSAVVLLGLAVLWSLPRARDARTRAGLAALLGAWALVMAPWWVRNARVSGSFVPFHTLVWYNAYHDDMYDAAQAWLARSGRGGTDWGTIDPDSLPPEVPRHPEGTRYPARLAAREDLVQEALYRGIVLRRFGEPGYLAAKVARNARDFWSAGASPAKARILGWTSAVWLALGLVAFRAAWRIPAWRWLLSLGGAFVLLTWAIYLPFLALFRHSLPTALFVAITIGLGLSAWGRPRARARSGDPGSAGPRSDTSLAP